MRPKAQHGPAIRFQRRVVAPIARDVGIQFQLPPLAVGLRLRAVEGAAMPEAAVHEDGDAASGEQDVGATPESLDRRCVFAKPEPSSVEF